MIGWEFGITLAFVLAISYLLLIGFIFIKGEDVTLKPWWNRCLAVVGAMLIIEYGLILINVVKFIYDLVQYYGG